MACPKAPASGGQSWALVLPYIGARRSASSSEKPTRCPESQRQGGGRLLQEAHHELTHWAFLMSV